MGPRRQSHERGVVGNVPNKWSTYTLIGFDRPSKMQLSHEHIEVRVKICPKFLKELPNEDGIRQIIEREPKDR